MKGETLIVVVALLIVGIIIVKNFSNSNTQMLNNTATEENQVIYSYDIEDQNFAEVDSNDIQDTASIVDAQNVIDTSDIEYLRSSLNAN